MRTLSLTTLVFFSGCEWLSEPGGAQKGQQALEVAVGPGRTLELADTIAEHFTEPQTGLRFPVPAGVSVDVQHFDPTLPAYKFRHLIQLGASEGNVVFIEVWDNPTGQGLEDWFYEHMQHLLQNDARTSHREVTKRRFPALVLESPRSPQAISLAFVFFAHEGRIYRVSCVDADAEMSNFPRGLFETLLAELEVAP